MKHFVLFLIATGFLGGELGQRPPGHDVEDGIHSIIGALNELGGGAETLRSDGF